MTHPSASATAAAIDKRTLGSLPNRMKVLYVATLQRTGGWLSHALGTDGATQILLEEVVGITAGLAKLRDEAFDAILISHEPGVLDALDVVEGLRAGGHDEPIIVLGSQPPQELDALCYEVGASDYCCEAETTVRGLLWKFARAVEQNQLARENRRLRNAERLRLKQEHLEAQRLLEQQRLLITDLEKLERGEQPMAEDTAQGLDDCLASAAVTAKTGPLGLPTDLVTHYHELLRTYVIMGVGNLSREMAELAEMLATFGVSAQLALQLHVSVLEELVRGLGVRSARHVMNRADLLVLEVIGHLADGYRRRYFERHNPPRQLLLPGFDAGECELKRAAA